MNHNIPNPFRSILPSKPRSASPPPPIPPVHITIEHGGGDDDGGGDDAAAAAEQRRYSQRQDYLAARLADWMTLAEACRTAHGTGRRERIAELMRSFDSFLVEETHQVSWPILWAFFDHLDKLGKPMAERYAFVIGGQFGDEAAPPAPVSKPLMMLLHQLGASGKKDVIPRIEKELIDLPGASFLFQPERDSFPGWLFVMTFLRGFQALPEATKQRHSPFHVWIERVPVPVAS